MVNNILRIIRMILFMLIVAFWGLFIYKYFAVGEFYTSYLLPIAGLGVFYLVTSPKLK